jgi:serine protease Do
MFEFITAQAGRKCVAGSLVLSAAFCIATARAHAQATGSETIQPVSHARPSVSFADVAKLVEPAVVSIDTKGRSSQVAQKGGSRPGESGSDVLDFLRQMPRRPSYSVGSGFLVDSRGYILTNQHVIEDAAKITVKLESGEEFLAKVIGTDEETDIAVLKIDAARDLPFLKLGDSNRAKVGDWVLAVGSPFGLTRTVTAGIISQVQRETPQSTAFQKFIQTDAAINRGNSGGPLVNLDGEAIGVNSQIATTTGDFNGVGFALPANDARFVYEQIVAEGKVRRGYLGITLDSVKAEFAKVYGMKDAKGAIVTYVRDAQTPAAAAGLQVGDIIVEFDGRAVESANDLISKVASTPPDRSISLNYLRESGSTVQRRTATIRLGERESVSKPDGSSVRSLERSKEDVKPFGLTLTDLTPSLAAGYKYEGQKGLLVKAINPESYIADVRNSGGDSLGEGDLIQRLNREPVIDSKTFAEKVSRLKPGDAVVLHVLTYVPATRNTRLKIVQFSVQ